MLNHDEVLMLRNNWHGGTFQIHSKNNAVLRTNGVYVTNKKDIELVKSVDELKCMVIPSMTSISKSSLPDLKKIILNDKYMRLFVLSHVVNKRITELKNERQLKKKTDQLNDYIKRIRRFIANDGNGCGETSDRDLELEICHAIDFDPENIQGIIDSSPIPIQDVILKLPGKNDSIIREQIQGKKSAFKNVHRRMPAFRSQIALYPGLPQDAVLLPYSWAHELNIQNPKIVDTTISLCDTSLLYDIDGVVLSKRDPAINGASLTVHSRVGFVKSDYIFVNIGGIIRTNADFDGDTKLIKVLNHKSVVAELMTNMHPRHSLMLFNESRLVFTESHILYMHQRNVDRMRFADIYKSIREIETRLWKRNKSNIEILDRLNEHADYDLKTLIEPTKTILERTISVLNMKYGSSVAYDFFEYINQNVIQLAANNAKSLESDLYDPNLELVYVPQANILCRNLVKCCLSGAAGSIDILNEMVKMFIETDGSTEITLNVKPSDPIKLFRAFESASVEMAKKSCEVPMNGSKFNQLNILWDMIEFRNGDLYYKNERIFEDINQIFDSKLFFNPSDLFYMTFC